MKKSSLVIAALFVLIPSTVLGVVYYYSFFEDPVFYPVTDEPLDIAVGDLNNDKLQDAVIATRSGRRIHVLMGNGDGTLTEIAQLEPGRGATSVALGDTNSDGFIDIVASICNYGCTQNAITIYHGSEELAFTPGPLIEAEGVPYNVTLGDFNGDGFLDIAASDYPNSRVHVYQSDGIPEEYIRSYLPAASGTISLESGDINNDGLNDLIAANQRANSISVFLTLGDGNFQQLDTFETARLPYAMSLEHLNEDQFLDLVIAHSAPKGPLAAYLGFGDGSFFLAQEIELADSAVYVATEDANGDELPDVIVSYHKQNRGSLFLHSGGEPVLDPLEHALKLDRKIYASAVSYLNDDPFPDLLTSNFEQNVISVLLGVDPQSMEQTEFTSKSMERPER